MYSAIWKDGPLRHYIDQKKLERIEPDKKVALKYLHSSQDITNEVLNEVIKI
jgi:hypothetical protein